MDTNPVTPNGMPVPEVPAVPTSAQPTMPTSSAQETTHGSGSNTPSIPTIPTIVSESGSARSWFTSMPKRTTFFIAALALVTIFLVYLAITQYPSTSKKTVSSIKPTPTPIAQTVLSLELLPIMASTSSTIRTVSVHIDSSINQVTAVQLELSFDPKAFTSVVATPGSFFTNPSILFQSIDMKTGNLTYALGISPAQTPVQGSGEVIRLQLIPSTTASATSSITILPKTLVTAKGVPQSVLKSGGTLVIPLTLPTLLPVKTTPLSGVPSAPATTSAQ